MCPEVASALSLSLCRVFQRALMHRGAYWWLQRRSGQWPAVSLAAPLPGGARRWTSVDAASIRQLLRTDRRQRLEKLGATVAAILPPGGAATARPSVSEISSVDCALPLSLPLEWLAPHPAIRAPSRVALPFAALLQYYYTAAASNTVEEQQEEMEADGTPEAGSRSAAVAKNVDPLRCPVVRRRAAAAVANWALLNGFVSVDGSESSCADPGSPPMLPMAAWHAMFCYFLLVTRRVGWLDPLHIPTADSLPAWGSTTSSQDGQEPVTHVSHGHIFSSVGSPPERQHLWFGEESAAADSVESMERRSVGQGQMIVDFFHFYSRHFDPAVEVVSLSRPRRTAWTDTPQWRRETSAFLGIEDPYLRDANGEATPLPAGGGIDRLGWSQLKRAMLLTLQSVAGGDGCASPSGPS